MNRLPHQWKRLGVTAPNWAVLTALAKKGGRWSREEFFAAAERETACLFDELKSLGIAGAPHGPRPRLRRRPPHSQVIRPVRPGDRGGYLDFQAGRSAGYSRTSNADEHGSQPVSHATEQTRLTAQSDLTATNIL
jgi:hypothetical protein